MKKFDKAVIPRWVRYLPPVILICIIAAVFISGMDTAFDLKSLQSRGGEFKKLSIAHPVLSAFIFMFVYYVFVAFSLPAATILSLLGGFLFGFWWGTIYVVLSATAGAVTVFAIARSSIGHTLRHKAGRLYRQAQDHMQDNAIGYLLFLRLVPIFPFFLVNILPALFNVSFRVFTLTTFFGILPGAAVYVNLGGQLQDIQTTSDLLSMDILMAFTFLGCIALTPTLYKRFKNMDTKKNDRH